MKITLYPKYLIRSLLVHGRHSFFRAGYTLLYPEYSRHGMTPWQHYVIDGSRKGYDNGNNPPDDLFFREGYEEEYPDVLAGHEDAWRHYATKGRAEGRDNGLHPDESMFFAAGYLEMYPDIAKSGIDPWRHYVLRGKQEGRDNGLHPDESVFFAAGYLEMYPDNAESGMDPWRHYVLIGKQKGFDNGLHPDESVFFAPGYLEMYPDIAKAGIDPWRHYVQQGKHEGRDNGLHPYDSVFFAAGYLEMYPDIADSGIDPWFHYLGRGKLEGRDNGLHPDENLFFKEGYLQNYPDVERAGIDPWIHYVTKGQSEGRNNGTTGLNFCSEAYLMNNPAVRNAKGDPWRDYVLRRSERERIDCLNDYAMRITWHEQEFARTIYLAPDKFNRQKAPNLKKALLIGHEFSVSGAPLALLRIAEILKSDGYLVDIAVRDICSPVQAHLYDGLGDVFLLPESTECLPSARNIVRSYDLVIVNTVIMCAYAALCRKLKVPHVWLIHESFALIQRFFESISGCRKRFVDDYENVLCVSKYVTDSIYNKYKIRCAYLNNFVNDVRLSLPVSEDRKNTRAFESRAKTFAVVGSVESNKSQQLVIAAFLSLAARPHYKGRWKLLFIGKHGKDAVEPSLGEKLDSVTKNVPNIEWCGQVTEHKWELFSSVDFFIVPSKDESSSLVTIEAAMLAKPVIITTHVGARYLAENNAGFLFEPGSMSELCSLVGRCIDMNENEYLKMSRQIRLNYEKTSTPAVYHKALSAIIGNAEEKCRTSSRFSESEKDSGISLRSLGFGANVITSDRLEYINFVDFSQMHKISGNSVPESAGRGSPVGVVVPVYNGIEHLKVLIPSLFRNTYIPHRFVFVDDCSREETADFLREAVKGRDDCILLRNEQNLGFVRSVNRGAEKALESCGSFVMLNSDTEVPSGWLGRLMQPIFDDEKISSVTPLSNRCTVFSFPFLNSVKNDKFLKEFGVEGINKAIQNSLVDKYIDIPTGHGFCMAISGKVWKKIGGLNGELFGRGYGEENEWSLRAELDGYRNILLPSLYVAHHEKGSFTSKEREANCASALDIINVMFPSYNSRVQNYVRERPASASLFSIYLTLAIQKGYKAEIFTDPSLFKKRMEGSDGIFAINYQAAVKIAVKLLGETVMVANARDPEKTGIFER